MILSYEEFKSEYARLFYEMMKYRLDQAGSSIYAQEMADLCEKYPEFEEQMDTEEDEEIFGKR